MKLVAISIIILLLANTAYSQLKNLDKRIGGTQTPFSATSKFDFIPGEKVIFYEDFKDEPVGDFPSKWNTSSSGEIVTINGQEGKWLKIPDNTLSFPEIKKILPLNFTVEFDLYYPSGITRPPITFGFTDAKNPAKEGIKYKKLFYFRIPHTLQENIGYSTSAYSGHETKQAWPATKMAGQLVHVSIAVSAQRIRLYLDEQKMFDLPQAFDPAPLRNNFFFRAADLLPAPKEGFYIANLRIAEAGLDARSQLLKNRKYSTTGIFFNTGSAVIKPPSFGIVKEIAEILKQEATIKIGITGHTDNDGNDAANLKLSNERSGSVKAFLVNTFGIDGDRLKTDGKGASQPVADNKTSEGRAQNRRVEFTLIN
jgi:outer membrane protein OmpA-like peptidoglycan-associated protein